MSQMPQYISLREGVRTEIIFGLMYNIPILEGRAHTETHRHITSSNTTQFNLDLLKEEGFWKSESN